MIQKQGRDDFVLSFIGKGCLGLEHKGIKRKEKGKKPLIFHIRYKSAYLQEEKFP